MSCFVPARVPSRRNASQHDAISQSHDGEWRWRPQPPFFNSPPPAASSTSWNAATTAHSPSWRTAHPPALPCAHGHSPCVLTCPPHPLPTFPSIIHDLESRHETRSVEVVRWAWPGPSARTSPDLARAPRSRASGAAVRSQGDVGACAHRSGYLGGQRPDNRCFYYPQITPKGGNRNSSAVSPPETASGCLGGQRRLLRAGPPRTPGGAGLPETSRSDRFPNAGTGGGSGIVRRRRVVSASQTRAPRSMRDRPGDSWGALPDMAPAARPRARVTRTGSRPQAHPSQAEPP